MGTSLRNPDAVLLDPDTGRNFRERNSARVTGTVKDNTGTAIPGSALDTFTWDLYNEPTPDQVINSRSDVDAKASVGDDGTFAIKLLPADMQIVDSARRTEMHRLLIKFTWIDAASVPQAGNYEIQIPVDNLRRVP